jgi:hypothetical protein
VIQRVQPSKVYLCGNNPGMDDPETLLRRLLGLLKYLIKSTDGKTTLSDLAAATSQKTTTIMLGLDWLESRGYICVKSISVNEIRVEIGPKTHKKATQTSSTLLNSALNESAAFRRYYLKADKDRLVFYE